MKIKITKLDCDSQQLDGQQLDGRSKSGETSKFKEIQKVKAKKIIGGIGFTVTIAGRA